MAVSPAPFRYMEEFWGSSKDFWQSAWTVVYRDWLGENAVLTYIGR